MIRHARNVLGKIPGREEGGSWERLGELSDWDPIWPWVKESEKGKEAGESPAGCSVGLRKVWWSSQRSLKLRSASEKSHVSQAQGCLSVPLRSMTVWEQPTGGMASTQTQQQPRPLNSHIPRSQKSERHVLLVAIILKLDLGSYGKMWVTRGSAWILIILIQRVNNNNT